MMADKYTIYKTNNEILKETEQYTDENDIINHLKQNESMVLKIILAGIFSENVKFDPELKSIEYKPFDIKRYATMPSAINMHINKFKYLTEDYKSIGPKRKKEIAIQILESIDADEAELITNMFKKKIKIKNINKDVVAKAFPEILD